MSVTFVKIETSPKKSCYLLTELKDGGKEGFKLTVTDGERVWGGELTEDDLDNLCTKMKMDFETYVKETVKAFTHQDVGDLSFEYQLKPQPEDTVNFIWKKYVPADDIRFQMGSASLSLKAEPTKFICKMFSHCVEDIGQLQARIRNLTTDNTRLTEERTMALKRLDKCVLAHEEVEKLLYSKFIVVLNSKKEKIRNLKSCSSGDETHPDVKVEVGPLQGRSVQTMTAYDDDSADEQSANIKNSPGRQGSENENTDDEESTPKRRRKMPPRQTKTLDHDSSLVLEDDTDKQTAKVVARPARRAADRKKQTPSKPILPKVTSKSSDGSASARKQGLRKSSSNSSNRSSDNIEPEDLFGDL